MRLSNGVRLGAALVATIAAIVTAPSAQTGPAPGGFGTVVGHVRMTAPAPANPLIRMGVDPVCATINRAARPVQQLIVKGADNALANAFVSLDGRFPKSAVPTQPVTITQQNCMYTPRVVGARVGQTLMVVNRDMVLHNVQTVSTRGNTFNITQPKEGMVFSYVLKAAEIVRLKCEVHSWMIGHVAVVDNPYFATTKEDGAFTIERVPAGSYIVHVWHEALGDVTKTVVVKAGGTTTVDLAYTSMQRKTAKIRELVIPDGMLAQLSTPH